MYQLADFWRTPWVSKDQRSPLATALIWLILASTLLTSSLPGQIAPTDPAEGIFREGLAIESAEGPGGQAVELYERASALGHVSAKLRLAIIYLTGARLPRNRAQSLILFRQAAEAGRVEAQYILGMLLLNEKDSENNQKRARHWLSQAAAQGHQHSQLLVGAMLVNGTGGEKNDIAAGR